MSQLGCTFDVDDNSDFHAKANGVKLTCLGETYCCEGKQINLSYPSVGATQNVILAAVCADGLTVINNAAREPEIVDLQSFLNLAGYTVLGAGTSTIRIVGRNIVSTDVHYTIMPDRIVTGTILFATAATGGEVIVKGGVHNHLVPEISTLREMGCDVSCGERMISIKADGRLIAPSCIRTMPYPGYPTDMQAITVSTLSIAEGTSVIVENVFESRFKYVDELNKLGTNIRVENKIAIVNGVKRLRGGNVCACDLRAGAALVIAGLVAEGTTYIENIQYIDRGYNKIEEIFSTLGADITRIEG